MKLIDVSVVVIGRNEGERLASCLKSVAALPGEQELIYVDSQSTDHSLDVARAFGAQVIVLEGGIMTAARARNAGWQRAGGRYVLFLDGDTILNRDFSAEAVDVLQSDPTIAAVWGHLRELHPEHSIYNRLLDLDWIYAPGFTDYCGGDVLMRRSALEQAEGYDPTLIAGEEPELCRRFRAAGYRIMHIDFPMAGHDLNMTRFSEYWRRAVRAGHAYAEISDRYRGTADPMWLQESRKNLLIGSFWIGWLMIACMLAAFRLVGLVPWIALLLVLLARSAWKARTKAPNQWMLLFLYGMHSHFQQVPILVGQLKYFLSRRSGEQLKRIGYKENVKA
jgi:glycosyltransferase involved in cell wall biosynthesis